MSTHTIYTPLYKAPSSEIFISSETQRLINAQDPTHREEETFTDLTRIVGFIPSLRLGKAKAGLGLSNNFGAGRIFFEDLLCLDDFSS